ncbi:MAG: IS30 family transposase, partial [Oscillospiraceae bacterium]|nr:IS30 family transposase [Oscillospiraceae bacterium]
IPIESITLDNGSEFAAFEKIEKDLQTTIYFADPHSPWQRGLNENTNDMLRFFFPKGTNFHNVTDEELQTVVDLINNRPRKTLDFFSPIEVLYKKCCT